MARARPPAARRGEADHSSGYQCRSEQGTGGENDEKYAYTLITSIPGELLPGEGELALAQAVALLERANLAALLSARRLHLRTLGRQTAQTAGISVLIYLFRGRGAPV